LVDNANTEQNKKAKQKPKNVFKNDNAKLIVKKVFDTGTVGVRIRLE